MAEQPLCFLRLGDDVDACVPEKADDFLPGSVRLSATTTRVGFPPEKHLGYPGRDARSETGATVNRARARTAWFLETERGGSRLKSRVRERGPRETKD
jgi:hypothetical protein